MNCIKSTIKYSLYVMCAQTSGIASCFFTATAASNCVKRRLQLLQAPPLTASSPAPNCVKPRPFTPAGTTTNQNCCWSSIPTLPRFNAFKWNAMRLLPDSYQFCTRYSRHKRFAFSVFSRVKHQGSNNYQTCSHLCQTT